MKKEPWAIPRMWPQSTVVILGGGPSLLTLNLDGLKDHRVIAVNQAFDLRPWFDICWFGDMRWFRLNHEALKGWPGLKVNCVQGWMTRIQANRQDIHWVLRGKKWGIDEDPRKVSWNYCSGSSAINLAYHLGASRVILVGFEMHQKVSYHYHEKYPTHWEKATPFEKFLSAFPYIKKDAGKLGLEIINATPDSAIKEFPYQPLEEALNDF